MRALACVLSLLTASAALAQDATPPAQSPQAPAAQVVEPPKGDADAVPLEEIRRYVGVFRAVKEAYVDPISDTEARRLVAGTGFTRPRPVTTSRTPPPFTG